MASGEAVIDLKTTKKLFSWTFNDFDKITQSYLSPLACNEPYIGCFLPILPIEVIDQCDGTKYTATCQIDLVPRQFMKGGHSYNTPLGTQVIVGITPFPGEISGCYQINDGESCPLKFDVKCTRNSSTITFNEPYHGDTVAKKFSFQLDITGFRTKVFKIPPFQQSHKLELRDELRAMWKNDPNIEFTIKCENAEFKVAKPIMAARSVVFKAMFETEMKEKSENFVEIKEFKSKVVEKMIEFCENDTVKNCEGFEDDLFKIAHLYQIQQLMYFAVEKMAENIKNENVAAFIQLADLYELNEFKEWCLQYAQRNNILV